MVRKLYVIVLHICQRQISFKNFQSLNIKFLYVSFYLEFLARPISHPYPQNCEKPRMPLFIPQIFCQCSVFYWSFKIGDTFTSLRDIGDLRLQWLDFLYTPPLHLLYSVVFFQIYQPPVRIWKNWSGHSRGAPAPERTAKTDRVQVPGH